jgi:hypothetical protein
MYRSYSLGQYHTMYDNPIYRWRISMAVALSELHKPSLRGYVAYRSIVDYLNEHGLALMEGEASPLPAPESLRQLIYAPNRLEGLLQNASNAPINYDLAPVPIIGSEKGEAAYYYWAFRLFGIHLTSLWYFYFLLLGASVVAFCITFWREPFCMLLLMLYLVSHLFLVNNVASHELFQTVHNSRFFPVLAMLPSLHLLLLGLRRLPMRLTTIIPAFYQTALLYFVIFSRVQTAWQPIAVISSLLIALPFSQVDAAHRTISSAGAGFVRRLTRAWPVMLLIAGGFVFIGYQQFALDRAAYATETKTHTFWDPLVVGTISANSQLMELYGMGQPPFSDTMGYYLARKYLVDHNDTNSPIALVNNGVVVGSFAMHNMGAYDRTLRQVFFEILRAHPWLVLWSFIYDKPVAELHLLLQSSMFDRSTLFWCIILAMIAGALTLMPETSRPAKEGAKIVSLVVFTVTIFSLSTIFVTPSIDVPDTILYFLLLITLLAACIPVFLRRVTDRCHLAFARSPESRSLN